ncbi:MAG: sigma 54-interacting transcriptional regulator [Leptospirales bacterium]
MNLYYVIFIDGLAAGIVVFLLIATLRKSNRTATDYTLVAIFLAELGWLLSDGLGFVLAVGFDFISPIHGGITGNMILLQILSIYLFCEHFPRGPVTRGFWIRLGVVLAGAIPLSVIAFTPLWIVDRRVIDGVKAGDPGPLFSLLPAWGIATIFLGLFVLLWRARTSDRRSRRNAYIFAVAALVNMGMALLVSYVAVYFGVYHFNFLGPVSCVVLVSSILYGISFHHFEDLKSLAIRYVIHIFVGATIGLSAFAYASTILNAFAAGFIAFFLGVAYYRVVRPRLEVLLQHNRPGRDRVVVEMLSGRLFDVRYLRFEDLLGEILQIALEKLQLPAGVVLARRPMDGSPLLVNEGPVELAGEKLRNFQRIEGRRLPEFALGDFDRVYLLEESGGPNAPQRATGGIAHVVQRLPRLGQALKGELDHLADAGFTALAPLVTNREICGYLVLKKAGLMYREDLEILDAIRTAAGVLIRNWRHYDDMKARAVQVEAGMERLSEVIASRRPTEYQLSDRKLVYSSAAMQEVLANCRQASGAAKQAVLILGETGTGKELVARSIHQMDFEPAPENSPQARPPGPFVAVNCAAIPASQWESDIFGHVRGAFTDARENRAGKLAEAADGTLFFDEIGEMPLEMQAKMLRLLQERVYNPIGSNESRPADCRFVFATNCDLEAMIGAGTFRRDLFYRINVFAIQVPPLRDRLDDIAPIAASIVSRLADEFGTAPRSLDRGALGLLLKHNWPGNIRELENVLTRACSATNRQVLGEGDLPESLHATAASKRGRDATALPAEPPLLAGNYRLLVNQYRRSLILAALRKARGNKTRAAELLGMKRTTLNGQMTELRIKE